MEGFGFASILVLTFASQVYLRVKEPDLERPIKVLYDAVHILFCLNCLADSKV